MEGRRHSKRCCGQKAYIYTYDKADRLLNATSRMYSGTTWTKEVSVHNEIMTYDDNGNIKTLRRYQRKHQLSGTTPSYVYDLADDLYVYLYRQCDDQG